MGVTPVGSRTKKMYLEVYAGSTGPKGLFTRKDGEKVFMGSLSGELMNIEKKLNKPKEGHKWSAYWSYELTFFDNDSDPQTMNLSLRVDNGNTDSIINSLASIENPKRIMISFWHAPDGYLKIFVYNGGETKDHKAKWKYGGFAGVPKTERTPIMVKGQQKTDAVGKLLFDYDRSDRDEFFEKEIHIIYQTFTGKVWDAAQVIGDNQANSSNASATTSNPRSPEAILKRVKENYSTAQSILDIWPVIAEVIRTDITNYEQRRLLVTNIQGHLNGLSDKSYTLDEDKGTYKEVVVDTSELPF